LLNLRNLLIKLRQKDLAPFFGGEVFFFDREVTTLSARASNKVQMVISTWKISAALATYR
jgi:hypothetical protein